MAFDASRVKWMSRNGENRLKDLCNDAGCTPTKPEYDEYGWDIFIDTPPNRLPILSLDVQPAPIKILCQVKTTDDIKKNPISMHVSNWEHLAKVPLPSFLYILEYSGKSRPQKEYLCHFDVQRIGQTLKRLRELHVEGIREIHKKEMVFSPREDEIVCFDGSQNILSYFQKTVGYDLNKYTNNKNKILKTVGFGEKPYKLKFNSTISLSDLVDAHLGLKSIEVGSAELSLERFGISLVEHKLEAAVATITPTVAGKCRIIASSKIARVRSEIEGDVYLPSIGGLDLAKAKCRIVSGLVEIIIDQNNSSINFDFNDEKTLSIEKMGQNILLFYAMTRQDSRLEIHSGNKRVASIGALSFGSHAKWSEILWHRIKLLKNISEMIGLSSVTKIRMRDISGESNDFDWLRAMIHPVNVNIKLVEKSSFTLENGISGIFATPVFIEMGDFNFCAFMIWQATAMKKYSDHISLNIHDPDLFDVVRFSNEDYTYLKKRHDDYFNNTRKNEKSFCIIREIEFGS